MSLVQLLPGPVAIHDSVKKAFHQDPFSHRSDTFSELLTAVQRDVGQWVHATYVDVMTGSGTLANEVVALQLRQLGGKGVVIVSGEFGQRLFGLAMRHQLEVIPFYQPWGNTVSREELVAFLEQCVPDCQWLWTVHCETSTGVLHDVSMLKSVCAARGMQLCLDVISSIGTVPLDLRGVYLATASSGKAIGSFAGLALICSHHEVQPLPHAPMTLDIAYWRAHQGIPWTMGTPAVSALHVAVARRLAQGPTRECQLRQLQRIVTDAVARSGLHIVAPEAHRSPAVVTIALPAHCLAQTVGDAMRQYGYSLSYESHYLRERNWIQMAWMGEVDEEALSALAESLNRSVTVVQV